MISHNIGWIEVPWSTIGTPRSLMIHSKLMILTKLHLKSVGWIQRGISILRCIKVYFSRLKIKIKKQICKSLHMKYFNRSTFISHSIFLSFHFCCDMNVWIPYALASYALVERNGLIHWCQAFTSKTFCSLYKVMLFII